MIQKQLETAILHLKNGGLIIYPTETAYAVGCDATNSRAVANIFRLKGRKTLKTLPLIAGSIGMVKRYAFLHGVPSELGKKFWPGPLTLILKSRKKLPPGVVDKGGWIAVRVSGSATARNISKRLGKPIVSTSANLSGMPPCYSIQRVKRQLGKKLKNVLCIDGGKLPKRNVSTIVSVVGKRITLIRDGQLSHKIFKYTH